MKAYFPLFIFFLSLNYATAQTIITDRPDQTESSVAVPKGVLQLESGILLGYESGVQQLLAPTNLFRVGLLNGVELRVVSQFESYKVGERKTSGIGDLEVGFKAELLNKEGLKTQIGLLSHFALTTGSPGIGADAWSNISRILISHDINDKFSIGYNLGTNITPEEEIDLAYTLALAFALTDKVGVYVEPYGVIEDVETLYDSIDMGFTYLVNDFFQLDFSFGTGIGWNMNYLSLGASWRSH